MFLGEALGLKALGASNWSGGLPHGGRLRGRLLLCDGLPGVRRAGRPELWPQDGGDTLAEPLAAEAKAGRFGFDVDTCGDAQLNSWTEGSGTDAWVEFTASSASGTRSAARATQLTKQWSARSRRPAGWRTSSRPTCAVDLHGDLWSGNIAAVGGGLIFDPAVYYGHHEPSGG